MSGQCAKHIDSLKKTKNANLERSKIQTAETVKKTMVFAFKKGLITMS